MDNTLYKEQPPTLNDVLSDKGSYVFMTSDALSLLKSVPDESFNCVITSPPYFQQREYDFSDKYNDVAIGLEISIDDYIANLVDIFTEVLRTLKTDGSLWLNIGDKFIDKELAGIPWRLALALKDSGWILRQDIIWHKMKGTQSAKDRFRNLHEHIFHFVKSKKYWFDGDAVRIPPKPADIINGISSTGVSGKKYYDFIEVTSTLTDEEKLNAKNALDETIRQIKLGEVTDFRMTLRGMQRTYHGENGNMSGRAKEIEDKGFFIMKMNAKGFLPSNVWSIVPEAKWRKDKHCAVFPENLLKIPLLSTCPPNGLVLDPFSGTGTTVLAAVKNGFRGVGMDISEYYNNIAYQRMPYV